MRTTLTLDDDVWALLERARERRGGATLKDVVNDALREGLARLDAPPPARPAYRTRPVSLGRCLIGSVDDVAEALAVSEGERFR